MCFVKDRLLGLWNDNIWLQHNRAFNAQVEELRRVPMHLSKGLVPLKFTESSVTLHSVHAHFTRLSD